jgi:hypothetical protein
MKYNILCNLRRNELLLTTLFWKIDLRLNSRDDDDVCCFSGAEKLEMSETRGKTSAYGLVPVVPR